MLSDSKAKKEKIQQKLQGLLYENERVSCRKSRLELS